MVASRTVLLAVALSIVGIVINTTRANLSGWNLVVWTLSTVFVAIGLSVLVEWKLW